MALRFDSEWVNAGRANGGIAGMEERARDLSRPLDLLGTHLVRKTYNILRRGERGIKARDVDGGLAGSLTYRVENQGLSVGSHLPYAGSQQFGARGGFIESSRPGGWLTIPIGANRGARGKAVTEIRDVPEGEGFFFKSKAGNLLFARKVKSVKRAKRARKGVVAKAMKLLFVLKQRVKSEAKNYCTFDPPDAVRWRKMARDWITHGR